MRNELIISNTPIPELRIMLNSGVPDENGNISLLHYHDEIELLLITKGAITVTVNGITSAAAEGDIVYCAPRIPHATGACEYFEYVLLQFRTERFLGDSNNIGKYFDRYIRSGSAPYGVIRDEIISSIMINMMSEQDEKRSNYELMLKGSVYMVIAQLCRRGLLSDQNSAPSSDMVRLLPAIRYINEHYSEEITLTEIAEVMQLTPSYFCRLFKRVSGSSFTDYLGFVRVCKSEKMLTESDMSILDIAFEVGFSSVSYFNRVFKKHKNCTPTEYRRASRGS